MALDLQTALSQYGLVGLYAKNNPEINGVLNQAIAGEWDSARFERALWDTSWWKKMSETKRQLDVMRVTDPATYGTTINQKIIEVNALFNRMGIATYPERSKYWAQQALWNGWDEGTLRAHMGSVTDLAFAKSAVGGGLTGEAGEVESHVRSLYAAYGMPVSDGRVTQVARWVIGGQNTLGGIDNEIRNQAKKQYAHFAEEIDAGMTLMDIAEPYIQTMASTLEINAMDIGLNDAYIRKALNYRDPKTGKAAPRPLWEFERELKSDPRWDKTKQANNETYAILQQIGQDFGFAS